MQFENHYIVSLLWTLSAAAAAIATAAAREKNVEPDPELKSVWNNENAIISQQSICKLASSTSSAQLRSFFLSLSLSCLLVWLVVLQQTYISCYLRCNFMFSRLLRILMFMFFLPCSFFLFSFFSSHLSFVAQLSLFELSTEKRVTNLRQ